jgi:hypothetical protein
VAGGEIDADAIAGTPTAIIASTAMTRVTDLADRVASIIGCYGTMRPDRTVVGHPSVTPACRSVGQAPTEICRVTSGLPALVLESPAVHPGPTGGSLKPEQVVGMDIDVLC